MAIRFVVLLNTNYELYSFWAVQKITMESKLRSSLNQDRNLDSHKPRALTTSTGMTKSSASIEKTSEATI